jgi:hypothetical protein
MTISEIGTGKKLSPLVYNIFMNIEPHDINARILGPGLLRKLKIAIPEKDKHGWVLREMEGSLPAAAVATWKAQVELWEIDGKKMNPFVVTGKSQYCPCRELRVV